MKHVLFTDESRTTLDGPDSWGNGWIFIGDKKHLMHDNAPSHSTKAVLRAPWLLRVLRAIR